MFDPTQLQGLEQLAAKHPVLAGLITLALVVASVGLTIRGFLSSASKAVERNTPIYIARQISKTDNPDKLNALSKAMESYCGKRQEADPPKKRPPAIGSDPSPPTT